MNSPHPPKTKFLLVGAELDFVYLFQHTDASTSEILDALAESISREHLTPTTDDLKVADIREAAEKVRKLEEIDNQVDEEPGTPEHNL